MKEDRRGGEPEPIQAVLARILTLAATKNRLLDKYQTLLEDLIRKYEEAVQRGYHSEAEKAKSEIVSIERILDEIGEAESVEELEGY